MISYINRFISVEMKNSHIRWVVFLGVLSIVGIIFSQVYLVQKAVENNQEEFNHQVQMALRNVVESLCELNGNDITNDPIDQVSKNYFVARTNYKINLESLDYLIKAELEKRSITEDFEYGVYDCNTDRMVYGDFISMSDKPVATPENKLPVLGDDEYYFGVYFPGKSVGLGANITFWKFTTFITILLVVFFGYTLFIILKQKRLSEIQRDFINNMTHEFKTPLSTLKLSVEALLTEPLSDRGKKYVKIVGVESERLQSHVTRLLETNSRSKRYKFVKIDVNLICEKLFHEFGAREKDSWALVLCDSPLMIYGDQDLFGMAFLNLLDNAEKYGDGQVKLIVESIGQWAVISFFNNGAPIPKSEQKKIFQKFYRIPKGDTHDVKGFGLGLAIVKNSIRLLKGTIDLNSDSTGTIFTIKLPKE
ncbi:MAG: two-component system phosphate regulon sensor histidine kinase PhoR [Cyclobacteriaceae bacterium]|jgi:two-component system phosphate regulon sensor histidine kinase PhoR